MEITSDPVTQQPSTNDPQNSPVHSHKHLSQLIIPADDPLLTDVWIGIILVLMVLICIGYICTCVLYHKFRRWKQQGELLRIYPRLSSKFQGAYQVLQNLISPPNFFEIVLIDS